MSLQRGLSAVNLDETDIVPWVEWFWPMSRQAYLHLTGIDPIQNTAKACLAVIEELDLDLMWGGIHHRADAESLPGSKGSRIDQEGKRVEAWGVFGTKWSTEGAHLSSGSRATTEDVLTFDPSEYDDRTVSEIASDLSRIHERNQDDIGDMCLVAEAHYTTLFHWFLGLFGWRPTISAALGHPSDFADQIEMFASLSRKYTEAYARVPDLRVFISHDDICMSNGPIFSPKWYRKYIFPYYSWIWEPLRERDIPVIFCSDGDVTQVVGDVFDAGADGFIFEPYVDLRWMADNWGGKRILIGNADTRVLTGGTPDDCRREAQRCVSICGDMPGYFLNAGGQLPHTIPWANLRAYLEECRSLRKRETRA